jgi:hypothetical protein
MDFHKMIALDSGKATEIIGKLDNSPAGLKRLMDELAEIDPHVNYELADKPKDVLN